MVKAQDFHRLDALQPRDIFRMIIILYGEKLADELARELVYNKEKYSDRSVVWPHY